MREGHIAPPFFSQVLMTAPNYQVVQKVYQNPHASQPLLIPILVLCNTSDEVLAENVRINAARDLQWLRAEKPHDRPAVMVGGGPSAAEYVEEIRALQKAGGDVFAMNGASKWLRSYGIVPDYQVLSDAKLETATLVDPEARAHLIASQVNPRTMEAVPNPIVWHLETGEVEKNFPQQRVARGGYALIGGGAATGNCAMCVAFARGYRKFHVFGYDSSHRDGNGHAYSQPMNDLIPTIDVEWAGKAYTCSVAMKAQAEKFQITSQALKQAGCSIEVYGDGLLQHMYRALPSSLSERDKYRTLWQFDGYRQVAPGEFVAPAAMTMMEKPGPVIDFGCGTGRGAIAFAQAGFDVILVDFADNCRDEEALQYPFLEWDLSRPCPLRAPYGICSDVMEHIPTADVDAVISNIMGSAEKVFFHISTVPDVMGEIIHQTLHLTVRPHAWWFEKFNSLGYRIAFDECGENSSSFFVVKENAA